MCRVHLSRRQLYPAQLSHHLLTAPTSGDIRILLSFSGGISPSERLVASECRPRTPAVSESRPRTGTAAENRPGTGGDRISPGNASGVRISSGGPCDVQNPLGSPAGAWLSPGNSGQVPLSALCKVRNRSHFHETHEKAPRRICGCMQNFHQTSQRNFIFTLRTANPFPQFSCV